MDGSDFSRAFAAMIYGLFCVGFAVGVVVCGVIVLIWKHWH